MSYHERASAVPGAVLWIRPVGPAATTTRILPDGCLDVIWDGSRLVVAGPDATGRQHLSPAGTTYAGLRLSGGAGPALVGVPADELRDRTVDLDELWPAAEARVLAEQVAAGPVAALERWAVQRAGARSTDPLGPRVLAMATAGAPVGVMSDLLGLSSRQLHRRCLALFGYGPRRLTRVQRMSRVLEQSRSGVPLAQAAVTCGYADQAHLSREVRELAGTTPTILLRESAAG